KIKQCVGCFTCWTKTPGVCIHQDDMTNELYPKWLAADLVVYAFPLYHYTVSAAMKTFIERTLPVALPFFEQGEAETYHPLRHDFPKVVVLSVAGLPEMSVFDQLSAYVRFLFGYLSKTLVAELYRPAAESLTTSFFREKAREIREAFVQAGREIVRDGSVSPATMALLTQDYIPDKEMFTRMGNVYWKTCIAEGVTPREFEEKGLIPRADSIETFSLFLTMGFNPAGAGETRAILQFNFSGDQEGSCHFRIADGRIEAYPGSADQPDLTIETPFEVWMDIMTGKADGQQLFMEQKYKANGNLSLLMGMNQFFGK
ncbi:MAG: SCP2 sterol-binding domain-containing protein, partial [Desulfobacterota bacterium]|nr:SCP2 sterol-binding domain-containing protein [Thermodesulfobacteriota bacterium]